MINNIPNLIFNIIKNPTTYNHPFHYLRNRSRHVGYDY